MKLVKKIGTDHVCVVVFRVLIFFTLALFLTGFDSSNLFPICPVRLELLYLGGNLISAIPPELAYLPNLSCLVLCDNRIQSIPPQLTR